MCFSVFPFCRAGFLEHLEGGVHTPLVKCSLRDTPRVPTISTVRTLCSMHTLIPHRHAHCGVEHVCMKWG